jgi:Fe2+ transport system protein FeoA
MKVGQSGYFSQCTADETACAFLADQGLRPGAPLQVLAVAPRGSLVEVDGRRVALSHSLAIALHVKLDEKRAGESPEHEAKGTELIQTRWGESAACAIGSWRWGWSPARR